MSKRYRVDIDVSLLGAHLFVEADDEEEARDYVEGMPLADLFAELDKYTTIEPEIEDVDEVDSEGRSLAVLARNAGK